MPVHEKISTGIQGLDQVIDWLRLGDNVVWQVDSIASYRRMVLPYVEQARKHHRNIIYVRFSKHEAIVADHPDIHVHVVDASKGFESFAIQVHQLIEQNGTKAFYVLDCLTDLLEYWHSDLMISNFFKVCCPFLYELDTIAYFALIRNVHTYSTIAGIRETTQVLLDVYDVEDRLYVHPLKVWNRYSPTMFFPHLIKDQDALSITASTEAAELFSTITRGEKRLDHWDVQFQQAKDALKLSEEEQLKTKRKLMAMILGPTSRMIQLCEQYFSLQDILMIATRIVGTGKIGGKSIGMLLARKILEKEGGQRFTDYLEPHDSFYLGTDVFYTYIVENGWWNLWVKQKTEEGYFQYADELHEKLSNGRFPQIIQEQFMHVLEYFGQSPIIVRSSSLLEDNFGNAFAGKYESVFCVNQGSPEERYTAFEEAVRTVYASTMSTEALKYRLNRGLAYQDEQMAILVQRVSGQNYGGDFFPHIAGVGNSSNLYVWDPDIDINAGMLRLVFGLGTRAVDRTDGDYARIVPLDQPDKLPHMNMEERRQFSQHDVDVLSLAENRLVSKKVEDVLDHDLKVNPRLFATADHEAADRIRELGLTHYKTPHIVDFANLLKDHAFPGVMRDILATLSKVYDYPVDIEYTVNFQRNQQFKINLVQCRPLQTKGIGPHVDIPDLKGTEKFLFATKGHFMGGNARLSVDYVIFVRTKNYMALSMSDQFTVARQIGKLNAQLKNKSVMLMGPGRWGTSTPSLGVPVHFAELCHMSVLCEISSEEQGVVPELSYGSHFFQDLVESGIFYAAIFEGHPDVSFHPEYILERPNEIESFLASPPPFINDVVHVVSTKNMCLYSDIVSQQLLCTI